MIVGKSVVHGPPDDLLNLVRIKRRVVRHPVEKDADVICSGDYLPHPVDETPRVPNRRNVRDGHEERRVCSTEKRVEFGHDFAVYKVIEAGLTDAGAKDLGRLVRRKIEFTLWADERNNR